MFWVAGCKDALLFYPSRCKQGTPAIVHRTLPAVSNQPPPLLGRLQFIISILSCMQVCLATWLFQSISTVCQQAANLSLAMVVLLVAVSQHSSRHQHTECEETRGPACGRLFATTYVGPSHVCTCPAALPVAAADMQAMRALAMMVLLACAASANTAPDTVSLNVRRPMAHRRLLATLPVDRSLCGPLTPASPGSTLGPGPCISQGRKLTCCGGGQCRIDTFLDAFTNPSIGATARDTANCNAWACCKV